jgi:uncharacterized protein (TIGR03437 family)
MPVVMVIDGGGSNSILGFSTLSTFSVAAGGSSQQTLTVTAPSASTTYTVTPSVSWLSTSAGTSTLSGSVQYITVTVTPGSLAAGTYTGTLSFNSGGNIQTVSVTMVVTGTATIAASPTSLSCTAVSGACTTSVPVVNITSASGSAPVSLAVSTPSTAGWLSAIFSNGLNTANTPAQLNVTITPGSLPANTYTANITVTPTGGTALTIPVTLTVQTAAVSATPTSLTFSYQSGGNVPGAQNVTVSGGGNNLSFTATAAMTTGSGWLSVTPTSGTTTTSGTTVAVQVSPSSLSVGSYTGTVTIAGTSGATGSTVVDVSLTVTAPLPTIASVKNAASYAVGAIAPGEIVAIFAPAGGTNPIGPATPATLTADLIVNGKLPTTLGGVQVLFNGYPAPIYYASAGQVNAIVPYEIAPVLSPTVWVKFMGQTSNSYSLTASATAPAIFTANGQGSGPAAALNSASTDSTFNAPNTPATKGSVVVFYVTGEGQTSPAGVTGQVTTLASTKPLTPQPLLPLGVTIDGQPAKVEFYGEAPGIVAGLLQLNVTIPTTARTGDLPLVVNIGGNNSQSGVTISVK